MCYFEVWKTDLNEHRCLHTAKGNVCTLKLQSLHLAVHFEFGEITFNQIQLDSRGSDSYNSGALFVFHQPMLFFGCEFDDKQVWLLTGYHSDGDEKVDSDFSSNRIVVEYYFRPKWYRYGPN